MVAILLVTILRHLGYLQCLSTAERAWIPIVSFVKLLPDRLRPPVSQMATESSFPGRIVA